MTYPKPVMKLSELREMGFPEEFLLRAYRFPHQKFAQKMNPYKITSPIIFDTELFDKWRMGEIQAQQRLTSDTR